MNKKKFFIGSILFLVVAVVILYNMIFPKYPPLETTGPYDPYTHIEDYAFSIGERVVSVQYWSPKTRDGSTDKWPLVLFSHGAFGTQTSNESLFLELASHGYVVASVGHTNHSFFTANASGKKTYMDWSYAKEVFSENAHEEKEQSLKLYQKWMAVRMQDIDFIIDTLIKQSSDPSFYANIDVDNIAVMGHSLGGSAALGIGRTRGDVKAILALEAPFMFDITDVQNGEFVFVDAPYPVPLLSVYTDSSWTHLKDWPQYKQNNRLLESDSEDVYNVHIPGSGHLSITDLALTSPFLTRMLNGHASSGDREAILKELNEQALQFFDLYLKGNRNKL